MQVIKKIFITVLAFTFMHLAAQNNKPILERKLTLKITNQPLAKVLNIISETANFNFSYSTSVVKTNKMVTVHAEGRTVKEILDQLFSNEISYQQIGNHLVLQKKIIPKANSNIKANANPSKYYYTISGYIRNTENGNPLTNVSIYEKQTLSATTSGDFGYYKLNITAKENEILLRYTTQQYYDTLIKIKYENNGDIQLNVNLLSNLLPSIITQIETEDTSVSIVFNDTLNTQKTDTTKTQNKTEIYQTQLGKWLISKYQKMNEKNIRDSFYRKWQASLIPSIGTNGKLSNMVANQLSFNLFAGYNGGLNGAEFGGFANILRENMRGVQFAGITNLVGGQVEGAQFAGIANHNIGNVHGAQFAGIYNYNNNTTDGVQFAGIGNISRGNIDGIQTAGIFNIAAKNASLIQLAGVINIANTIDGGQIASVVNIARKIRGFQIGLINIADTAEGITLGIINFIKNGVHQLEINLNANNMYGVTYRSGTGKLYSIISLSSQAPFGSSTSLMGYGYGIGTNFKMHKRLFLTLDIGSQQLAFNFNSDNLQLHNRLNLSLEYKIIKGISIFGGTSLNHLIVDKNAPMYNTTFKNMGGPSIWQQDGMYPQHAWIGYQFGVRLF